METSGGRPTPDEAAAALLDAGSARDELSHRLTLPSWFYSSIGLAIVVQTATLAVGVAAQSPAGLGLAVAGLVAFALVAVVQLVRFRRLNGVWVGGLASRVVFGGDAAVSTAHFLAMAQRSGRLRGALVGSWACARSPVGWDTHSAASAGCGPTAVTRRLTAEVSRSSCWSPWSSR